MNMKVRDSYILITIVITLCLLEGCSSLGSDEIGATAPKTPPSAETIARADQLFNQRQDLSKLREAIGVLRQVRMDNLRTYEVEWKYARCNYFLARHTDDDKEREKAFEDGKAAAQIARQLDPTKPDGHFWYGANLGEQANRSPLMIGLKSVDEIRSAMNKVVELKPDYELASAYDALGAIEIQTRLVGGKPEKAVEYLEKALALEKNNGDIRIHLAEAYLALKKDAEAKKLLESVMQIDPHKEYMPEYQEQVEKAKTLLRTKF